MAQRKLKDKNIRKLTRMGGGRSMGLTLPVEILRELGWRKKQKVVVKRTGKRIVIEDWKR
ncbi:AbrB/MazE/SpoVT family DNA-binding domain-containing protein [Candidatus Parcubacteria bacterium]|nr:AbrB/MazE/SpoVT family DNA-binding domain-containing protein [Candidatus Parcubacteria bacterium]